MAPSTVTHKSLEALGFQQAENTEHDRLILVLGGLEGKGKTHFALGSEDPLALINFDIGQEGVIDKFLAKNKVIYHRQFHKPVKFTDSGAVKEDGAQAEWLALNGAWYKLLRIPDLKTIVVDTETEMWELIRLARFGKLESVQPWNYPPVNREYGSMLKAAYDSNKSLILLQKMRKEYKNDKWTGAFERAGFGDTRYVGQVVAHMHRYSEEEVLDDDPNADPVLDSYAIRIDKCRQNPALEGYEFNTRATCNWDWLKMSILQGLIPEQCMAVAWR